VRICSPQLRLSPNATLGGEVYDREVLKHLAQANAEIEIILPKGQPYEQNIKNWHVHYAPLGRGYRWYVSNLIFPRLIKRVYDQTHFHLLRVHSLRFIGPAALWAKKRYRLSIPVVAHHHHIDPHWLNKVVDKKVVESCSLVTTDSQFSKQQLVEEFGISYDHVKVVYAGINSLFKPQPINQQLAKKWDLTGKKVIFTLGSLSPRKNLKTLLDIFQQVVKTLPNQVVLVIAGRGPELANLRTHAAILGIENHVRFTEFITETDKIAFYNISDLYVSTSSMEGFGMTPAEAMACGKPAVVSDAGSLPEVVLNEKTGFVISPKMPELFAQKIITLLTDVNLAQQFGQAGLERVKQNFRWDIVAQKTLTLYQELIA
jgi:glycosyltransferase involved in cell wall biosynthesis